MSYLTITDPTQAVMFLGEEVQIPVRYLMTGRIGWPTIRLTEDRIAEFFSGHIKEFRVKAPEIRVGDVVEHEELWCDSSWKLILECVHSAERADELNRSQNIRNLKLLSRGEGVPVR